MLKPPHIQFNPPVKPTDVKSCQLIRIAQVDRKIRSNLSLACLYDVLKLVSNQEFPDIRMARDEWQTSLGSTGPVDVSTVDKVVDRQAASKVRPLGYPLNKTPHAAESADLVAKSLRLYMCVMFSFLLLSWIIYGVYATPNQRPFFDKNDRLMDLLNYIGKTRHLYHSSAVLGRGLPVFSYSPPAAILWHVLLGFPNHPLLPYFFLVILAVGTFLTIGIAASSHKGQASRTALHAFGTTVGLGWPLWFALDRGNLEGLMWAISGAGICFFLRKNYRAAAVCIGLAGCIKPFPFVFCVLLLFRRKFKEAALAAAIAAALVMSAYIFIGPNPWKAYQDLKPGVVLYTRTYIQTVRPSGELRFSHSILDELKLAAAVREAHSLNPSKVRVKLREMASAPAGNRTVRILAAIYPAIALAVLTVLILFVSKAPALNQVTILAIAATLLPPNSAEYTLLNLYVPFGAFVVWLIREVATGSLYINRKTVLTLAVTFGLLFAPLTFLGVGSGAAKLILLLLLTWIFIRTPMTSSYFGDSDQPRQAAT